MALIKVARFRMIIRIFIALLALNMMTFVVRAEASEPAFDGSQAQDVYELQEHMSGDFERNEQDELTRIGSRLLSLGFSEVAKSGRTYGSDAAVADHGVALLQEGACLNLKWNF